MENDTVEITSQQRNNFLSCKVWKASMQDLLGLLSFKFKNCQKFWNHRKYGKLVLYFKIR